MGNIADHPCVDCGKPAVAYEDDLAGGLTRHAERLYWCRSCWAEILAGNHGRTAGELNPVEPLPIRQSSEK